MATERDLEFARVSLEKGYVQAWQLEECMELRDGVRPLEAVLIEKGYLSVSQLADINSVLGKKTVVRPSAPMPKDVADAAARPGNVFGKYVLLQELGSGGMGVVYKAWQTDLHRTVALKFLRGVEVAEDLSRFMREAQTAAQLSHPGIVSVFETGEIDGKHYIAMPFVDGLPFDRILQSRERFPLRRLVAILAEVARAVDHANAQGIIHRDLKPGNIMVDKDGQGRVFVLDFGLAKSVKTGSSLTVSGVVLGTPSYMPPEQGLGKLAQVDARSDVYALGAILYEIGTGQPPFYGDSSMDIIMRVIQEEPPAPRKLNPKLHPDLETIALKALEKSKDRRYPNAGAFADDLQRWLDGELISARPAGTVSKILKRLGKNKAVTAAVVIAVLAVLAGGAFGVSAVIQKSRAVKQREAYERGQREARERRDTAHPFYEEGFRAFEQADRERFSGAADLTHRPDELAGAERQLRQAIAADPDFADAHALLGRILVALERDEEAILEFTRAVALEPGNVTAFRERGMACLRRFRARAGVTGFTSTISDRVEEAKPYEFRYTSLGSEVEAFLREIDDDLKAAARLTEKPYERALASGVAKEARCRPEDTADLEEAIRLLTEAARIEPNLPDPYNYRAWGLMLLGRLDEALADGLKAALIAPNDGMTLHNLCLYFRLASRDEEALPYSERLLKVCPREAEAHVVRAALLRHLNRAKEAIDEIRAAVELDPSREGSWVDWGIDLARQGSVEASLDVLRRGMERCPKSAALLNARAVVYSGIRGRLEDALADFRAAARLAPDDPYILVDEGVVLTRLQRFDEAAEAYRQALKLKPDCLRALVFLALIPSHKGHPEESLKALEELAKKEPKPRDLDAHLAKVLFEMNRLAEAESRITAARERFPKDVDILILRAQILIKLERPAEALEDADRALKIAPRDWSAMRQRGSALVYLQRFEEAVETYKAAHAIDETWETRANAGYAHMRLNQLGEALREFDAALRLNPTSAACLHYRGSVKLDLGEPGTAVRDFTDALKLAPDDSSILWDRGMAYGEMLKYDKAVEDFNEIEKRGKAGKQLYYFRGNSYLKQGKGTPALADFEKLLSLTPDFVPGVLGRARAKFLTKDAEGALKDFEKVIELDPGMKTGLQSEMDAARRLAKGE